MASRTTFTTINDGGAAQGNLFENQRFWVAQRIPSRNHIRDLISANGGTIVSIEKNSDYMIADHARKDAPPGSISWRFIEASVKKGRLEDPANYPAGAPTTASRPVGSSQPKKTSRTPFTSGDDQIIIKWVTKAVGMNLKLRGNEIWKQLEQNYPHHTYQSWRDRYVKYIRNSPRDPAREDQAPEDGTVDTENIPLGREQNKVQLAASRQAERTKASALPTTGESNQQPPATPQPRSDLTPASRDNHSPTPQKPTRAPRGTSAKRSEPATPRSSVRSKDARQASRPISSDITPSRQPASASRTNKMETDFSELEQEEFESFLHHADYLLELSALEYINGWKELTAKNYPNYTPEQVRWWFETRVLPEHIRRKEAKQSVEDEQESKAEEAARARTPPDEETDDDQPDPTPRATAPSQRSAEAEAKTPPAPSQQQPPIEPDVTQPTNEINANVQDEVDRQVFAEAEQRTPSRPRESSPLFVTNSPTPPRQMGTARRTAQPSFTPPKPQPSSVPQRVNMAQTGPHPVASTASRKPPGFTLWRMKKMEKVKKDHPGETFSSQAARLNRMWAEVPDEEKAKWDAKAARKGIQAHSDVRISNEVPPSHQEPPQDESGSEIPSTNPNQPPSPQSSIDEKSSRKRSRVSDGPQEDSKRPRTLPPAPCTGCLAANQVCMPRGPSLLGARCRRCQFMKLSCSNSNAAEQAREQADSSSPPSQPRKKMPWHDIPSEGSGSDSDTPLAQRSWKPEPQGVSSTHDGEMASDAESEGYVNIMVEANAATCSPSQSQAPLSQPTESQRVPEGWESVMSSRPASRQGSQEPDATVGTALGAFTEAQRRAMEGQRQKRRDEMDTQEFLEGDTLASIPKWEDFPESVASDADDNEDATSQNGVPESSLQKVVRPDEEESQTLRADDSFNTQPSRKVITISTDNSSNSESEGSSTPTHPISRRPTEQRPAKQRDFSPAPSSASSVSCRSTLLKELSTQIPRKYVDQAVSATAVKHPARVNPKLLHHVAKWLADDYPFPANNRGVWTKQDDDDLLSFDDERMDRVTKKHGADRCETRWEYLEG